MNGPLEIGKIVNTHGLKGEVKVTPWCDRPSVFSELDSVIYDGRTIKVENVKFHKNSVILKLSGVESIEAAEKLKNGILLAKRSQLGQLPEGTYYINDLIGLEVYEGEESLGKIEDCFPTGSNDVYVVRSDEGRQLLIPAIKQVIKNVDIKGRRMDVELLKGLDDLGFRGRENED